MLHVSFVSENASVNGLGRVFKRLHRGSMAAMMQDSVVHKRNGKGPRESGAFGMIIPRILGDSRWKTWLGSRCRADLNIQAWQTMCR